MIILKPIDLFHMRDKRDDSAFMRRFHASFLKLTVAYPPTRYLLYECLQLSSLQFPYTLPGLQN